MLRLSKGGGKSFLGCTFLNGTLRIEILCILYLCTTVVVVLQLHASSLPERDKQWSITQLLKTSLDATIIVDFVADAASKRQYL